MIAEDIMTKNPITANDGMTVGQALSLLHDLDVRHLPVVRDGELVGIISDRDLRALDAPRVEEEETLRTKAALYDAPVSEVMNTSIVQTHPETSLAELVDLLTMHRVGAVPVVDPSTNQLAGIVSYIDVLRAQRTMLGENE